MDDPRKCAAIRVRLDAGEDPPGIDAQLFVPLLEQLAGEELASVVAFLGTAPTDSRVADLACSAAPRLSRVAAPTHAPSVAPIGPVESLRPPVGTLAGDPVML